MKQCFALWNKESHICYEQRCPGQICTGIHIKEINASNGAVYKENLKGEAIMNKVLEEMILHLDIKHHIMDLIEI